MTRLLRDLQCTTICEDGCGAPCHEVHYDSANRDHEPEDCPSAVPEQRARSTQRCAGCRVKYDRTELAGIWCGGCIPDNWRDSIGAADLHAFRCDRCNLLRWTRSDQRLCEGCRAVPRKWRATVVLCPDCKQTFRPASGNVNRCDDCGTPRDRHLRDARALGSHTRDQWLAKLAEYGGLCAYCRDAPGTSKDHVIPVSRGGSDDIRNIVPACTPCNSTKKDKPVAFLLGRLALRRAYAGTLTENFAGYLRAEAPDDRGRTASDLRR